MPHVPQLPPTDRFFARLDKFEMECPACGQVFPSWQVGREAPLMASSRTRAQLRHQAKVSPAGKTVRKMVFNPLTQRVECPSCHSVYVLGILAYSIGCGRRSAIPEPPDTVPTAHERAALRRRAGGWWLNRIYQREQEVNIVVEPGCLCPLYGADSAACPVHGEGAKVAPNTST